MRAVARIGGIKFGSEIVQERTGHAVQRRAGIENQTPPRLVLSAAGASASKARRIMADGLVHRQKFLNIRFGEKEHASKILSRYGVGALGIQS